MKRNLLLVLILFIFCACSKNSDTMQKLEIRVLFSPEGFCGNAYNDIILRAMETNAQKHGFEYSFYVPVSVEAGMEDYNEWYSSPLDEGVSRALYVFASNIYEEPVAKAQHPDIGSGKELLIFEVEKELSYAHTFAFSYYGSTYFIANYYHDFVVPHFFVIAANPYTPGLNYILDALNDSVEDAGAGSVEIGYISQVPGEGFGEQDWAYFMCMSHDVNNLNRMCLYIPYAGLSNLGVYRYARLHYRNCVGVDVVSSDLSVFISTSMMKRMDLALDDFFSAWCKGKKPEYKFYTLESQKVKIAFFTSLIPVDEDYDRFLNSAIKKENEYLQRVKQ